MGGQALVMLGRWIAFPFLPADSKALAKLFVQGYLPDAVLPFSAHAGAVVP